MCQQMGHQWPVTNTSDISSIPESHFWKNWGGGGGEQCNDGVGGENGRRLVSTTQELMSTKVRKSFKATSLRQSC